MPDTKTPKNANHLPAAYLRDHFAGAAAGLALAERCERANDDNPLGSVMAEIAAEIATDRGSLRTMMSALGVSEDPIKAALGHAAEVVGRLKSNGMFTQYSPSSRVIELEGFLAGLDAKRNLWYSLRLRDPTGARHRGPRRAHRTGELATRPPPSGARARRRHRFRPRDGSPVSNAGSRAVNL